MQDGSKLREEHKIIGQILAKYPEMTALTQEEQQVWEDWLARDQNRLFFEEIIADRETDLKEYARIVGETGIAIEKFHVLTAARPIKRIAWFRTWRSFVAAASLIILAGAWFYFKNGGRKDIDKTAPAVAVVHDAPPGKFKAKLTLDDGSVVVLDSAAKGKLVQQGNTSVVNEDGKLVYQQQGKEAKVLYNTLTTSRGESYATVLSDGSKVWLNSQSTIRYPVVFNDDVRKVEITGEAYFEVAPGKGEGKGRRPFIVTIGGMEVEVLGTHFNIKAYDDEAAIKTTLLEGKVVVRENKRSTAIILTPGQQAQLGQDGKLNKADQVDLEKAVAWKNGYFQFDNDDLETILREVGRWYDKEVTYERSIPEFRFGGIISRKKNLSEVLKALELSDVRFHVEGRKIIVLK